MASIDSKNDETNDLNAPAASQTFDKIGTAAAAFNDRDTGIIGNSSGSSPAALDNENAPASPLGLMTPLIILFLLIGLGYAFCRNPAVT